MSDVVAALSGGKLDCFVAQFAKRGACFIERTAFAQIHTVGTEIGSCFFRADQIISHQCVTGFAISSEELLVLIRRRGLQGNSQRRCCEYCEDRFVIEFHNLVWIWFANALARIRVVSQKTSATRRSAQKWSVR